MEYEWIEGGDDTDGRDEDKDREKGQKKSFHGCPLQTDTRFKAYKFMPNYNNTEAMLFLGK